MNYKNVARALQNDQKCYYQIVGTTLYVVSTAIAIVAEGVTSLPQALNGIAKQHPEPNFVVELLRCHEEGKNWQAAVDTNVSYRSRIRESETDRRIIQTYPKDGKPYTTQVNDALWWLTKNNRSTIHTTSPSHPVKTYGYGVTCYVMPMRTSGGDLDHLKAVLTTLTHGTYC